MSPTAIALTIAGVILGFVIGYLLAGTRSSRIKYQLDTATKRNEELELSVTKLNGEKLTLTADSAALKEKVDRAELDQANVQRSIEESVKALELLVARTMQGVAGGTVLAHADPVAVAGAGDVEPARAGRRLCGRGAERGQAHGRQRSLRTRRREQPASSPYRHRCCFDAQPRFPCAILRRSIARL